MSYNNIQIKIENLDYFTLYKNIKNVEKIADDSVATVEIYLSYLNSELYSSKTTMRLYDSKCTYCNLAVKPVRYHNKI